ncbi:MAG: hypothetical protein ACKVT1_08550 [Dehalococcoidia bacterium]
MIPAFFVTYLLMAGFAVGLVSSFFVAVSVRNRLVTMVAQLFNVVCNPLATAAAQTRSFVQSVRSAVPDTAFADGTVKRLLFLVTFLILAAVDVALAGERMAALFGIDAAEPPFDVSWATGFGWVIVGGLFASVSLDLRHEVIGHPFDRLAARWHRPLRVFSDTGFVVVLVSGLVFYVTGSLLAAGWVSLWLVVAFMALLGLSLIAASGLAFWAGMDSWTTAWGVVLVVASLVVRFVAFIPEMLVVSLRRLATFVMSAIDLPLLGVAYPLLRWWAGSKLGKALGFPALEEPIPWPAVGYVEPPAERLAGQPPVAPITLPVADNDDDTIDGWEEAA